MKRVGEWITVVSLLLALVLLPTQAMAAERQIEDTASSLVRVVTENGYETAFAIGQHEKPVQYFVTCGHVIANSVPDNIGILSDNLSQPIPAHVKYYSKNPDIAILYIDQPIDTRKPLTLCPSQNRIKCAEPVRALGFCVSGESPADDPSANQEVEITTGQITMTDYKIAAVSYMQMDNKIACGNSGGPLFNESGEVIGVVTAGASLIPPESVSVDPDYPYASYIDCVIDQLDRYDIPYELARDARAKQIMWVWIIGGVLIVCVAAVSAYFLVSKDHGGADTDSHSDITGMVQEQITLYGISGPNAGKRYLLRRGMSINIGRDPSNCQVVLPPQTPGVSSVHCRVRLGNKSGLTITDLNSSNGTFVQGTRLTAGQAATLNIGDSFYLGDPKITYHIN